MLKSFRVSVQPWWLYLVVNYSISSVNILNFRSVALRIHEQPEQIHDGDCEITAWRCSDTQPELRGVFVVELGLQHEGGH